MKAIRTIVLIVGIVALALTAATPQGVPEPLRGFWKTDAPAQLVWAKDLGVSYGSLDADQVFTIDKLLHRSRADFYLITVYRCSRHGGEPMTLRAYVAVDGLAMTQVDPPFRTISKGGLTFRRCN